MCVYDQLVKIVTIIFINILFSKRSIPKYNKTTYHTSANTQTYFRIGQKH